MIEEVWDVTTHQSPGSRETALVETRIKVMTWNVWWRFGPWQERAPLIDAVVAAEDPDILCLQEVWDTGDDNQGARLAESRGYDFAFEPVLPIDGVTWGMAILSRWPIVETEGLKLVSMPSDDGSRDCRAMRICVEGPRAEIDVFNTHLSWRPEEGALRQKQVADLCRFVENQAKGDMPPIVCGDFNAVPTSDEVRMMTGEAAVPVDGLFLFDAWRAAGHTEAGFTWDNINPLTHAAPQPNRRLDYVFVGNPRADGTGHVTGAWQAGAEPVDGLYGSDHFAVVAEIRY